MAKAIDLTGQKFGKLTVMRRTENDKNGKVRWVCVCDCEDKTERIVYAHLLKNGNTVSCGCHNKVKNITHGHSNTRIYGIYKNMICRCTSPSDKRYSDYGGRGIIVCEEWLGGNGMSNFYNWAMSNGYSDDLTIDRKDVNGNYEPNNCRWATQDEQANNKRNSVLIEVNGETKTVAQWSNEIGIPRETIYYRIKKGKTGKQLIETNYRRR